MQKRVISWMLMLCMMLTLLPAAAFAEEAVEAEGTEAATESAAEEPAEPEETEESAVSEEAAELFLTGTAGKEALLTAAEPRVSGETWTVDVTVQYGQSEARKMLDMINDFRVGTPGNPPQALNEQEVWVDYPGLQPLKYDAELEKIAMQRAAECALKFSHTRPDGTKCFSAFAGYSYWPLGENIAVGTSLSTAESAFVLWREDDRSYSGQGHRRNMLGEFTTIGIGHVVYNGVHYWAQAFGSGSGSDMSAYPADDGFREVPIRINSNQVNTTYAPQVQTNAGSVQVGECKSVKAPRVQASFYLNGTWPQPGSYFASPRQGMVCPNWTATDPSVVEYDPATGTIRGKKAGFTTLTANVMGTNVTASVEVTPKRPAGWYQDGNGWWYNSEEDTFVTGWQKIDGNWYYFNGNGYMQTGWVHLDSWFYFGSSGVMATGWQKIDGSWYYFNESGYMQTGWQQIDGAWYLFGDGGNMRTGWVDQGGRFYFLSSGVMATGWQWIDGNWYCFNEAGYMQTGWQWNNGSCYYLDTNGAMVTDVWIDGSYVDESGAWVENVHAVGWQHDIHDRWWYNDSNGNALTGWQKLADNWFYFDPQGIMVTGWLQSEGCWYYFDENGCMVTGWAEVDGKWYYMDQWGAKIYGWAQIDGNWRYFGEQGMAIGWVASGNYWYYFDGNGCMVTGWVQANGGWYYMDQWGAMIHGWAQINGNWYYFNESGRMQTGWQLIENVWYYFYDSGAMAVNTTINGCYVNGSGAWV